MAAAQGASDVGALMSQIAQRVSGYYERPEVRDFLLEALLQELRQH